MTSSKPVPQRQSDRRRRRRVLLVCMLVLIGLPAVAYWYVANPQRAARLAEGFLNSMINADVSIETAQFGLDGTIELNQLEIRLPNVNSPFGRLFTADRVLIEHQFAMIFMGQFRPQDIHITKLQIYRSEDLASGKLNFQMLGEQVRTKPRKPLPVDLPGIRMDDARVHFCEFDGTTLSTIQTERLEGFASADPASSRYAFFLQLKRKEDSTRPSFTGTFDAADQSFVAYLANFTVQSPHRNWLPRKWRQWWDDYQPTGTVKELRIGYDIEQKELLAKITIDQAQLIPPYTPFIDARIRMTNGAGQFTFSHDRIEIANLTGLIEGIRYRINGEIYGFERQAPFRLEVRADRFMINEESHYLMVLPESVVKVFEFFKPAGEFGGQVLLERLKNGELRSKGVINLHDVSGVYHRFPYPLHHLRGHVKFDSRQLEISVVGERLVRVRPERAPAKLRSDELVSGAPLGGSGDSVNPVSPGVKIYGRWMIGRQAPVDLHIEARNVPLDDLLYRALPQKRGQEIYDRLLDQTAYQKLIDAKLVSSRSAATSSGANGPWATEGDPPVFDLGGLVNVHTHVTRVSGIKARIKTEVEIDGVNILMEAWPYPLHIESGQLIFAPEETRINRLEGHGLSDHRFTAEGRIVHEGDKVVPDIRITMNAMPLDNLLLASIPNPGRKWLTDLHIICLFDAKAEISGGHDGRRRFIVRTNLTEGSANPYAGQYHLDDLTGQLTVRGDGIDIDRLSASHGKSRLVVTGKATWATEDLDADLQIEGQHLRFEDPIADLAPSSTSFGQGMNQLVTRFNPTGVYDGTLDLHYRNRQPTQYHAELRPQTIDFDLHPPLSKGGQGGVGGRRVELHEMTGSIVIEPDQIRLHRLGALIDDGRVDVSGKIARAADWNFDLTASAEAPQLGPSTRAILPSFVSQFFERLNFVGGYKLHKTRIVGRAGGQDQPAFTVEGTGQLSNASANLVLPVEDLTGQVDFKLTTQSGHHWPLVDIRLNAQHLRALNRIVSPFVAKFSNTEQSDILRLETLAGECYEGLIHGSGQFELREHGHYELRVALVDCQVGPFLQPDVDTGAKSRTGGQRTNGLLSASLTLEGYRGLPDWRLGRGGVAVREANLYEWPLSLALLQITNLTFPTARAFESASTEYLIDGDKMLFDHLVFEAPSVRVAGYGSLDLPTNQLDLDMVPSNPDAWDLGPLGKVISRVKDELVGIHVGGTLREPNPQVTSFRGTVESWLSIFGRPPRAEPLITFQNQLFQGAPADQRQTTASQSKSGQ